MMLHARPEVGEQTKESCRSGGATFCWLGNAIIIIADVLFALYSIYILIQPNPADNWHAQDK
jgi:hypothetical protein